MITVHQKYAAIGRLKGETPPSSTAPVLKALHAALSQGTLPCLTMPYAESLQEALTKLEPFLHSFKHMIVLGIGGSALGARTLQQAFFPEQDYPKHKGRSLWIADNLNAKTLSAWTQNLDPKESLVVVISKSGGTVETMAQYSLFRHWLSEDLGEAWTDHVFAITDEEEGVLRQEVKNHSLKSLPVPKHLGGRFSVFSAVGLVPAAFLGIDWKALLQSAKAINASLVDNPREEILQSHPAWSIATWAAHCMQEGYDQLIFFNYIAHWPSLGAWFNQLWAESLGKNGKGSLPVPALGATDQHSLLQMFLDGKQNKACLLLRSEGETAKNQPTLVNVPKAFEYLEGKSLEEILQAECLGTAAALAQCQIPLMHISLKKSDEEAAGAFMALCMTTTLFTAWLIGVNPVDQPAVELSKKLSKAQLLSTTLGGDLASVSDKDKSEEAKKYEQELAIIQQFLAP